VLGKSKVWWVVLLLKDRTVHDQEKRAIPTSPLPLNDFVVLDLTAHRAGPTAVRQLADWGAQVIKVDPPGEQDGTHRQSPRRARFSAPQ
jgi:crotonobetainyl-CoA:carnitine CoA-transferase CaiB-like acyl-CoA transferase